jgi:hypothetical protein
MAVYEIVRNCRILKGWASGGASPATILTSWVASGPKRPLKGLGARWLTSRRTAHFRAGRKRAKATAAGHSSPPQKAGGAPVAIRPRNRRGAKPHSRFWRPVNVRRQRYFHWCPQADTIRREVRRTGRWQRINGRHGGLRKARLKLKSVC